MSRRVALLGLLLSTTAFMALVSEPAAADPKPRRPNIIVILADDLGYADIGCHGCKDIPTPHIDALAKDGVRCTSGYAAAPVGAPTRAALFTGRYPQRFGHEFNPPRDPKEAYGLTLSEKTLANMLKDAGYATGLVGKWHLGSDAKFHPLQRGFQEFFGFLDGAHYYLKGDNTLSSTIDLGTSKPWPNGIMRGTKLVEEKEYLTDAFTREAVAFVDAHGKDPFFLCLSYNAPHTPLEAPEKYLRRVIGVTGGDQRRRVYAAMIAALDDGVGAVVAKVKEKGLDKDTLIFFLSDNGGITGYLSPSSNAPFLGTKSELLEGGIRVPYLVKWPGRLPAGTVYDKPVSVLDILPTALAAAGTDAGKGRALDGVDLSPYFSGKNTGAPHEMLFWRFGPSWAVCFGSYKLLQVNKEPLQLFDLTSDSREARDLAKEKPELVKRLTDDWKKWDAQLVKPAWSRPLDPPWW